MKQRHTIPSTATLQEALGALNALSGTNAMTLFVIDADSRLMLGTLTDGDVRRALLEGVTLERPVTDAMHRQFQALRSPAAAEVNVRRIRELRRRGITLVPVLNESGMLTDIIDLNITRTRLPLSAILMAGGMGERLRPLTLNTPKPLLQIEGKAIIDYNIESLAAAGVTDITVTTRYLSEQIHEHFKAPVAGVEVRCVTETQPLGTIGSAALVELPAQGDTLVMNSDLITTVSFEDMYLRHAAENADITIAVIPYQVSVPFAILQTDGNRVQSLDEKPTYSYLANAGIYIVRNELLRALPADRRTDATDLIEQAITDGRKVVYHVIDGTWLDVGSPSDFARAAELMRHHRNLTHHS